MKPNPNPHTNLNPNHNHPTNLNRYSTSMPSVRPIIYILAEDRDIVTVER